MYFNFYTRREKVPKLQAHRTGRLFLCFPGESAVDLLTSAWDEHVPPSQERDPSAAIAVRWTWALPASQERDPARPSSSGGRGPSLPPRSVTQCGHRPQGRHGLCLGHRPCVSSGQNFGCASLAGASQKRSASLRAICQMARDLDVPRPCLQPASGVRECGRPPVSVMARSGRRCWLCGCSSSDCVFRVSPVGHSPVSPLAVSMLYLFPGLPAGRVPAGLCGPRLPPPLTASLLPACSFGPCRDGPHLPGVPTPDRPPALPGPSPWRQVAPALERCERPVLLGVQSCRGRLERPGWWTGGSGGPPPERADRRKSSRAGF